MIEVIGSIITILFIMMGLGYLISNINPNVTKTQAVYARAEAIRW